MTERVMCPYNLAHSVEPRRFRQHLDKCRKTAQNAAEFDICKYDWNHHVRKKEIRAHEATCPSRVKVEKEVFKLNEGSALSHLPKPTVLVSPEALSSAENWDEDAPQMKYDPEERIRTSKFMIMPNGLTPSERKAYYREHEQRLMQMNSAAPPKPETKPPVALLNITRSSAPEPRANTVPTGVSQQPLRPPLGRGRGVLISAGNSSIMQGGARAPGGPSGRGWSSTNGANAMTFNDNDYPPLS